MKNRCWCMVYGVKPLKRGFLHTPRTCKFYRRFTANLQHYSKDLATQNLRFFAPPMLSKRQKQPKNSHKTTTFQPGIDPKRRFMVSVIKDYRNHYADFCRFSSKKQHSQVIYVVNMAWKNGDLYKVFEDFREKIVQSRRGNWLSFVNTGHSTEEVVNE